MKSEIWLKQFGRIKPKLFAARDYSNVIEQISHWLVVGEKVGTALIAPC